MKTLWVVSGGAEAVPGILRAREMGLHLVVSDASISCPGAELADDFVQASTYGVEASVAAAINFHQKVRPIDGVICFAADVPLTVASIAHALGLPGIPLAAARLATDKLAMKDRFVEAGIPVPWYSVVKSSGHLAEIVKLRGLPLVIKPVDSRGARGVLLLQEGADLHWAFDHAERFSPSQRVMVEEFLEGPQISTESVLLSGQGFTPGFCDRNYEYIDRFAPYIIENGGHQPSILNDEQKKAICLCAEDAGRAMGIHTGIAKGDMVWTSRGPKVIEMAARLSGGWFSSDQIPLATGVDLVGSAIQLALGEQPSSSEVTAKFARGVAIRYIFPRPGKIVSIDSSGLTEGRDGLYKLGIFVKLGDIIEQVTNHTQRAGFVIATGIDRDDAVMRAAQAVRTVHIETV